MIRFTVKYLDGIWRSSYSTMHSKDEETKYAKELVEMFRHFLHIGSILGYTVVIETNDGNDKHIDVIGTDV